MVGRNRRQDELSAAGGPDVLVGRQPTQATRLVDRVAGVVLQSPELDLAERAVSAAARSQARPAPTFPASPAVAGRGSRAWGGPLSRSSARLP